MKRTARYLLAIPLAPLWVVVTAVVLMMWFFFQMLPRTVVSLVATLAGEGDRFTDWYWSDTIMDSWFKFCDRVTQASGSSEHG